MNKIIEFFKALIAKRSKTVQTGVIAKTEQKSEEVQTSQHTEVDSLKSTKKVKKTADSVNTEKKPAKRCGRPRKVKSE